MTAHLDRQQVFPCEFMSAQKYSLIPRKVLNSICRMRWRWKSEKQNVFSFSKSSRLWFWKMQHLCTYIEINCIRDSLLRSSAICFTFHLHSAENIIDNITLYSWKLNYRDKVIDRDREPEKKWNFPQEISKDIPKIHFIIHFID